MIWVQDRPIVSVVMDNIEKVQVYVYKNYKTYKDKPLIIEEFDKFFTIKRNKDESPLILGKSILD